MAKFEKVGKGGRLGQIIRHWDEDGDKSQGDAVKSWTLSVMDMKNDEMYPAYLRYTNSLKYLSTRYSELYSTMPLAKNGTWRKGNLIQLAA